MQTIILGADGFIGKSLTLYFLSLKYDVVSVTRRQCDLLDNNSVTSFFETTLKAHNTYSIVNCAVLNKNKENSYSSYLNNIIMLQNILNSLKNLDISSFIHFSSYDVYGSYISQTISEDSPTYAEDWYSLAKLHCERMLLQNKILDGKRSILRIPGIYSLDERDNSSIVALFKNKILANEEISLVNNGSILRDYVHIDDICELLHEILKKTIATEILNIGSGESLYLSDIVKELASFYGKTAQIAAQPSNNRTFDIIINNTKLINMFNKNIIKSIHYHMKHESEVNN